MIAFVMNAVAWEPVIKETHWFGIYEYVDYGLDDYISKKIKWNGNYLESITIAKDWTGQNPPQAPTTSFYSWLDHKLRFSVGNTGSWGLARECPNQNHNQQWQQDNNGDHVYDGQDHYDWNGMGLCNISDGYDFFYIHDLNVGDQISIEYYVDKVNTPTEYIFVYDKGGVTGALDGLNHADNITSKQAYTVSTAGDVHFNVGKGIIIRSVTITHADYVASDFKVEKVEDVSSITGSFGNYLGDQGVSADDPSRQFGALGYRYSFKGAGVLEDKRGAAPYITMKFGNDNDMTFVRRLADVTYSYGSVAQLDDSEVQCYMKENGGDPVLATTSSEYVVNSAADATNDWDAQFFITAPYSLPAGQTVQVEFSAKADHEATVATQQHAAAGDYISYNCIGNRTITTEYQKFTGQFTTENISNDHPDWLWQSIAFNLNIDKSQNNTFYFKDIKLSIPEKIENVGDDDFAAASIIDASDNLDPATNNYDYLQYRLSFNGYNRDTRGVPEGKYTEEDIKNTTLELVGKEWSTFTAQHDYTVDPTSAGTNNSNGQLVIYGDLFDTIWPLCGNFFYFFPEVDGLLQIDYYCEGSYETPAFWYKQRADGSYPGIGDQPKVQHVGLSNGQTNGFNNYSLRVNVEKGGIYYLCSLPTNMSHEKPILRLKSYTFIPRFSVAPLYKVVKNTEVNTTATQKVAEIKGGPYNDLNGQANSSYPYELTGKYIRNAEEEVRVKCLGNVASAKAWVEVSGGKQYLSFSDITFKEGDNVNPGGAVVAHVENGVGEASFVLTIAYDAADAKWNDDKTERVAATTNGEEVKRWDFYSSKDWDLGQYGTDDGTRYATNPNDWKAKSKLFKETHKADGLTADWEFDYVDVPNQKEPLFKSIYDMEADNADMIHETAGLVFFTEPNELGIWNENEDPESKFQDRFIGLMGGGKLIIPRLKKDDRVVIKMGCFGNVDGGGNEDFEQKAVLWLTNAKDAKGTVIPEETDYIIGGSMPYTGETQPHGEYHFIVNQTSSSDDTDFAIEVQEAGLLKIYSIVIYRNAANENADILTENSVTGLDPEILFTSEDEDESTKDITCYMRYSGYKETSTFNGVDQVRGNLSVNTDGFGDVTGPAESYPYYTVKASDAVKKGDFGSFRAQMAVKTKDDDNTYVTDYAPGSLAVGYLETMDYPYTWDFTDLLTVTDGYVSNAIGQEEDAEASSLLPDYKGWKENSGSNLRNAPEEEPGVLFANGGQLYAANVMFKETAGLGFKRSTDDVDDAKKQNESVCIAGGTTGVLEVDNVTYSDRFVKIVIPKVPANAAIYMRATPIARATVKAQYSKDGETSEDMTVSNVTFPANSTDKIYVMKNTDEQDVELWLNGLAIKKIAVSTAPKKLNTKGWASESREYVTDPALASYMTGKDIRTYIVSKVDYPNKQVTLERIDARSDESNFSGYLMPAAVDGDNNACVILNYKSGTGGELEGEQVNILDGGFHLFVPDMHDKTKATWSSVNKTNILVSQVSGSEDSPAEIPAVSNGFTNFAFTCKYYDIDPDKGTIVNNTPHDGPQAFYRIAGGENGKATSKGHQGYLPIKIEKTTTGNSAGARFSLVIVDGDEITGVSSLESVTEDNGRFYNLNGQQLDGIPNRSGLYIVNGKKVSIKNK